jgi:hypothetical protein
MAIVFDKDLGEFHAAPGTGTSVSFTTSQTVASDGLVVLGVAWWHSGRDVSSVTDNSGSPLTYVIDVQGHRVGPTNPSCAMVHALAPGGLPSGTVITATYSGATDGRAIAGVSFTGHDTASPVDATGTIQSITSVAAWTTGSIAIEDGSVLVGISWLDGGSPTSTITAPSIEVADVQNLSALTMGYRIESSAGSYAVAGTWSSAIRQGVSVGVAYSPDTSEPSTVPRMLQPVQGARW